MTGCTRTVYTVPTEIDFPQYNMKCSGENVIHRGIFHVVSCFPLHFMLYCGNLDNFSDRVYVIMYTVQCALLQCCSNADLLLIFPAIITSPENEKLLNKKRTINGPYHLLSFLYSEVPSNFLFSGKFFLSF